MPHHELPTAELGRYLSYVNVAKTTQTPVDTLLTWHKLWRAMGFDVGKKVRGIWRFSAGELYQFNVAAALSTAGHPVGLEQLRQIFEGTQDKPEGSLFLSTGSTFAIVAVDLTGLWDTLAHMLSRVEADADA